MSWPHAAFCRQTDRQCHLAQLPDLGFCFCSWSMFFYPMYQQYFGVLNACRLGLLGTIPLCFGLALPSFLPVDTLALQLILAAVLWLKNIMATNSFTAAVIMVRFFQK